MRKLAILLGLGGALGFPSLALALDTVTIQCTLLPAQSIFGIQTNTTPVFSPPPSCATGAGSSCAQCIRDLRTLATPFFVVDVINVDAESGYSGPYYVLER